MFHLYLGVSTDGIDECSREVLHTHTHARLKVWTVEASDTCGRTGAPRVK